MKKLMIAIGAAAAAFGLYAANNGNSFENAGLVKSLTLSELDASETSSQATWDWFSGEPADATLTGTAYAGGEAIESTARPVMFQNANQDYYLAVKTPLTNGVYRTKAKGDEAAYTYSDMLVKFTAFEEGDAPVLPTGSKLGVWAQVSADETVTNLMVTAGYWDGSTVEARNYNCGTIGDIDAWHRITVKMVPNASTAGNAGLVVFLDGVNESEAAQLTNPDAKAKDSAQWVLTAAAGLWGNALFPAIDNNSSVISAIGVAGQGAIDDVVLTTESMFANSADKTAFTVTWDSTIKSVTVNDGSKDTKYTTSPAAVPFASASVYTYTYEAADDYVDLSTATAFDPAPAASGSSYSFKATAAGAKVICGDVTNKCADVAAAVAYLNGVTVAGTYTLALQGATIDNCNIDIDNSTTGFEVVLDIAGKTLNPEEEDGRVIRVKNCALTIINSTDVVGTVNGLVTVGKNGALTITGGRYKVIGEEPAPQATLPEGKEFAQGTGADVGYWVLVDKVVIVTHTLICPDLTDANVTVVAKTNGVDVLTAAGSVAIVEGDTVDVIWTAAEGYLFDDGKTTKDEQITAMAEDTTLEVPTVTAAEVKKGSVYFLTLQDALDAAGDETITLLKDNDVEALTATKAFTLDLNDFEISGGNSGWLFDIQNVTAVISNGTITANNKGIKADEAAGLKLYGVTLTATDRAVNMSNEGTEVPGELYIDADTTITSSGECGVICGNGNSSSARKVTVDGDITSYKTALQISGNNTAVVNGDLELTTYTGGAPALYFGGTWYNQTGTGTQPTLTLNGSVKGKKFAVGTDGGDKVGVKLTIGEDAEITAETYGLVFQVCGSLTVNGGTFDGATAAYVAKTDNQEVAITAGVYTSTTGAAVVGDDGAAAFISGGYYKGTEATADALLVSGKKFQESTTLTGYYEVVDAPVGPTPINPDDDPVQVSAKTEDDAKAAVQVARPTGVTDDVVSAKAYDGYFAKTAVETSTGSGIWNVTATLKDEIVQAVPETTEVASELTTFTDSFTLSAENVKPGLYYAVYQRNSLTGAGSVTEPVLATTEGAEIEGVTKWPDAGFYKVLVGAAPADLK